MIMKKTRGFVTIATGDKRYYMLAANLLASYKRQSDHPLPFAIIAEEENEYTRLFDTTVIIDTPARSFMDKIKLPEYVPYDENIFIDADCLVYQDINFLFDYFDKGIGLFSAIGEELPLDSDEGWFKKENIGEFADQIAYVAHLHGGMYFIRKDKEKADLFIQTCKKIITQYSNYQFRIFEKPADEPVFALVMAVHHLPMVPYQPDIMCFYPSAVSFDADIRIQRALFEVPWYTGVINGKIVHWANFNTNKAVYRREVDRLVQNASKTSEKRINAQYHLLKMKEDIEDGMKGFKIAIYSKLKKKTNH